MVPSADPFGSAKCPIDRALAIGNSVGMATRNPHDGSYKSLLAYPRMVRDLLLGFVHQDWVALLDFDSLESVGTGHVSDDLQERDQDLVWRVRLRHDADDPAAGGKGEDGRNEVGWIYLYLLIEFQRQDDPTMAVRVLAYTALLYQDLIRAGVVARGDSLPPVFPLVLYNGQPPWHAARDVAEMIRELPDELLPYRPAQRYFLIDEIRLADAARQSGTPLPDNLAGVMVGIEGAVDKAEFGRLGKALLAMMPPELLDSLGIAFTAWINRIVARRLELDENEKALANFREVSMLGEQVGDLAELYRNRGRSEGRVEILERQLQRQFGAPLPEWVRARLEAADVSLLDQWAEQIFDAKSLEELLEPKD